MSFYISNFYINAYIVYLDIRQVGIIGLDGARILYGFKTVGFKLEMLDSRGGCCRLVKWFESPLMAKCFYVDKLH